MTKFVEEAAASHVAQSLEELKNPDKCDRWMNGDRAKEQAASIVAGIIAEAQRRLEERILTNES